MSRLTLLLLLSVFLLQANIAHAFGDAIAAAGFALNIYDRLTAGECPTLGEANICNCVSQFAMISSSDTREVFRGPRLAYNRWEKAVFYQEGPSNGGSQIKAVPELGTVCDFGNLNIKPMGTGGIAAGNLAAPSGGRSVATNIYYDILTDDGDDTFCSLQLFVGYPEGGSCRFALCKQTFLLEYTDDSYYKDCDKKLTNLKIERSNLNLDQQKGGKGLFHVYFDNVKAGKEWGGLDNNCAVGRAAINSTGTCCRTRWDDTRVKIMPVGRPRQCAKEVLDYSKDCGSVSVRSLGKKEVPSFWNINLEPTVIPGNGTLVKLVAAEKKCKTKGLGLSPSGTTTMTAAKSATILKFVPLKDTCDQMYIVDSARAAKGLPAYLSMSTSCGKTTTFYATLGKANTIQKWSLSRR